MSFNPQEILQRLRSQQNASGPASNNHNSDGSSNYYNSMHSNNFDSLQQQPPQQYLQQFNQAHYNNIQLAANGGTKNQFVNIQSNNKVTYGKPENAGISSSIDSFRRQNNQNVQPKSLSRLQQQQQGMTSVSINSMEGNNKQLASNDNNPNQLNSNHQNGNGNYSNDNIQNGSQNNNQIMEYLLDRVNFLEKQVMEQSAIKNQHSKTILSPSNKLKTEELYEEVAEVIRKEPVEKILQKKEKNFVSCAGKNSKRFNQPKIAGKLNLEQLQRILVQYPSLSRPCLNIRITEEDLN